RQLLEALGATATLQLRGRRARGRWTVRLSLASADTGAEVMTLRLQAKQATRMAHLLATRVGPWTQTGLPLTHPPRPAARVVLAALSGDDRNATGSAIKKALGREPGLALVPLADAQAAAEAGGHDIDTPEGRAVAGETLDLSAVMTIELTRAQARHLAVVTLFVEGRTALPPLRVAGLRPASLADHVAAAVSEALQNLQDHPLPAPVEPPPVVEPPPPVAPTIADQAGVRAPPTVVAAADGDRRSAPRPAPPAPSPAPSAVPSPPARAPSPAPSPPAPAPSP
ncbi:MAG: hypothetical protein KC933_41920, partial [Myxococcales bacterium]|nr:hypothetical protein [Myxococcales bacterium]